MSMIHANGGGPRRKKARFDEKNESYIHGDQLGEDNSRSEVVSQYVDLPPIPKRTPRVAGLTREELLELERVLEFEKDPEGEGWRDDWSGNIAYLDKEISNPKSKSRDKQSFKQSLLLWARNSGSDHNRIIWNVLRYVYHMPNTPEAAKVVIASTNPDSAEDMEKTSRRLCYDPSILKQDGWTVKRSAKGEGSVGGPSWIGDHLRWQNSDAVVIAYVYDNDLGDLWRALFVDADKAETFDLEAEELLDARRKWERRQSSTTSSKTPSSRRTTRVVQVDSDFSVKGIEYGIVLGASYSKNARPGVYWPARVMHASELATTTGKRNSSKQKVDLVFLAPYWSPDDVTSNRKVESRAETGTAKLSTIPLLSLESVDANEEMIQPYPYSGDELDLSQLELSFRFTGLPVSAFQRFVDSHRLALSLRSYANHNLDCSSSVADHASAGLFNTHPLSVRTPIFPHIVLNLPYEFILSQLPSPKRTDSSMGDARAEPVINLASIVDSMKPRACLGQENALKSKPDTPVRKASDVNVEHMSPRTWQALIADRVAQSATSELSFELFAENMARLQQCLTASAVSPPVAALLLTTSQFLSMLSQSSAESKYDGERRFEKQRALIRFWAQLKRMGEDVLGSLEGGLNGPVYEWHVTLERMYQYCNNCFSKKNQGKGVSFVLTDERCNGHLTSYGCFERTVRLPAALKAARLARESVIGGLKIKSSSQGKYRRYVEESLLQRAHDASYLKRMKDRCSAAKSDDEILRLTDDSDGEGGEDTRGSRGTWDAAVAAVAVAVEATEMVVFGECVNAFCATRPPGHHAGRLLHPMKAVSNGFCILNSVACAAIHATLPHSEGGLGLTRVCIIDFDVHHGNGTQDILCSTYDPRYLYVSLHAGGVGVNGATLFDEQDDELNDLGNHTSKQNGIYPGRCGDSSPNPGVLNIPLGVKLMSHAVGSALLSQVSPAVEAFEPDIIILSAGFDAHKNDPMGLGGLSAEDFGHITDVACRLASRCCSGRLVSVLEGGYGVPCCRPQRLTCLPVTPTKKIAKEKPTEDEAKSTLVEDSTRPQPSKLVDLGEDLPTTMDDQVPFALQKRLEKCHAEGFIECVQHHIQSLARCK